MRKIELDYEMRIKLTGNGKGIGGILGMASGPLGKMDALGSAYSLIRFSDEESEKITVKDLGNGAKWYEPPHPGWGSKTIEVEELWASMLREELIAFNYYTLQDTRPVDSWLRRLQAQLAPK